MNASQIDWIARSQEISLRVRDFIDGRWRLETGEGIEKYSPRDGRLLCRYGAGQVREVDEAVVSARRAFDDGRWSKRSPQFRKETLQRLASLIEEHREELALLETLDVGKPIRDSLNFDVPAAAAYIKFSAEAADKFYGKVYAVDQSSLSYQVRRPLGVVAGIIGWNFPLYLAAMKIGPALSTGNSLVLKPSELTSFSAGRIAELASEAGIPDGVLNVIHGGPAIGAALAHHRDVDLLTFTGSSRTGKKLLIAAGESNMKRLLLECGDKAPNIVFDDSPGVEAVADGVVSRAFWNQGQVCSASSRLLIQEGIKDELLRTVSRKAAALVAGDPLRIETTFGALVSRDHRQRVLDYITAGEQEGARMVHQSRQSPPFEGGFYVAPTIFDRVSPNQRIAQEEIFGPVLAAMSFRDEEEAIRIANGTIYGLTAIVWTRNLGRAHRMTQGIRAGMTVVNATESPSGGPGVGVVPVGGHKESGMGTESGIESLEEYVSKTAVQVFV
jgi:acyl-CoA reductase-like NAD-dependent aldehyde dehydrogenase